MSQDARSEQGDSCGTLAPNIWPAHACVLPQGHEGAHQAGEDGDIWFLRGIDPADVVEEEDSRS